MGGGDIHLTMYNVVCYRKDNPAVPQFQSSSSDKQRIKIHIGHILHVMVK